MSIADDVVPAGEVGAEGQQQQSPWLAASMTNLCTKFGTKFGNLPHGPSVAQAPGGGGQAQPNALNPSSLSFTLSL